MNPVERKKPTADDLGINLDDHIAVHSEDGKVEILVSLPKPPVFSSLDFGDDYMNAAAWLRDNYPTLAHHDGIALTPLHLQLTHDFVQQMKLKDGVPNYSLTDMIVSSISNYHDVLEEVVWVKSHDLFLIHSGQTTQEEVDQSVDLLEMLKEMFVDSENLELSIHDLGSRGTKVVGKLLTPCGEMCAPCDCGFEDEPFPTEEEVKEHPEERHPQFIMPVAKQEWVKSLLQSLGYNEGVALSVVSYVWDSFATQQHHPSTDELYAGCIQYLERG